MRRIRYQVACSLDSNVAPGETAAAFDWQVELRRSGPHRVRQGPAAGGGGYT